MTDINLGRDDQDRSEIFDEDNVDISETGGVTNEFRTFEELPEVLDVTSADGDGNDEASDEDDPDIGPAPGADGSEPEEVAFDGSDAPSEGEVELVYAGFLEDARGAQASAAHWESRSLSDEDIEDLGYAPDGDDQ